MISVMGNKGQTKPVTIVISTTAADADTTALDYIKDARRLTRILFTYLPSGTYDRLLKDMFNAHMRETLNQRELAEMEDSEEE